jgi:hypothetical protein
MYIMWLNCFIYLYWLTLGPCIREAFIRVSDRIEVVVIFFSISRKLEGWYGTSFHAVPSLSLTLILPSDADTLHAVEKDLNNETNYGKRWEVFTAVTVHIVVFWVMSPSRRYQIFWEVVGLERGPLSLGRISEELFQGNSGSGLENRN